MKIETSLDIERNWWIRKKVWCQMKWINNQKIFYNTMNKRLQKQCIFICCNKAFSFVINSFMIHYVLFNVLLFYFCFFIFFCEIALLPVTWWNVCSEIAVAKMFTTKLPRTPQMDATEAVEIGGSKGSRVGALEEVETQEQKDNLITYGNFRHTY